MRKFLAVLCVLIFCTTAYAAKYPAMGVCNADRVRLRASPGTKGKFLGFVEPDKNRFVLLGEARADGMKWYKIDHPTKKGTAYIAADYVEVMPVGSEFAEVRLTCGNYPEKTIAIFGKPSYSSEKFVSYSDSYSFWYDKNGLYQASIQKDKKKAIAGIHVGDKAEKLSPLGIPVDALEVWAGVEFDFPYGDYVYKDKDSDEQIVFVFVGRDSKAGRYAKNAVINSMMWSRPHNED